MPSSTPSTRVRRLGAFAGPALVGAFILTSCGGGDSAASVSTLDLSASSTAFVVRTPATTIPPADTAGAGDPTAVVDGTQNYTVQSGDAPYVLVKRFGITLADLLAVNEWTDPGQFPFPGTVILIPPGATSVDAAAAAAAAAAPPVAATVDPNATTIPPASIPTAGDNCAPGKYTLVAGDVPIKVAKKFDVTVDALNAANASTSGYSAFYVGLEIVIPAKADC